METLINRLKSLAGNGLNNWWITWSLRLIPRGAVLARQVIRTLSAGRRTVSRAHDGNVLMMWSNKRQRLRTWFRLLSCQFFLGLDECSVPRRSLTFLCVVRQEVHHYSRRSRSQWPFRFLNDWSCGTKQTLAALGSPSPGWLLRSHVEHVGGCSSSYCWLKNTPVYLWGCFLFLL